MVKKTTGISQILGNEKFQLALILLLALLLFTLNIGRIPFTDGDTLYYAKMARNMLETGNWLTLQYNIGSSDIHSKPPLMIWMMAASFKLFGVNEFGGTIWHSLLSVLTVLLVYLLGREMFGRRTGLASAIILLTMAQFFYMARSPLMDMPLTLFITASLYSYYLFEKRRNLAFFYLTPVFMALAFLTKGPVGLALPALTIFIYILVNRKWPFKKAGNNLLHIILGVMVFLLVAAPWFVIEYIKFGKQFLDVFISSNFGRYLRPIDLTGQEAGLAIPTKPQYNFYQYFLEIFVLVIPWSGFVYPALFYSYKKKELQYPFIWTAVVILFFTLSLNYKVSRYILPAYPALALLIGRLTSEWLNGKKDTTKLIRIANLTNMFFVIPVLILAIIWLGLTFKQASPYYMPMILPFLIVMCVCLIAGSTAFLLNKKLASVSLYASVAAVSYLVLILLTAIYLPVALPIKEISEKINSLAKKGDIVCQYKGTNPTFIRYYVRQEVRYLADKDQLVEMLASNKKVYCMTENTSGVEYAQKQLKSRIRVIETKGPYTLFGN